MSPPTQTVSPCRDGALSDDFVNAVYQTLQIQKTAKAEALRQAQIALITKNY